MVRKKPDVLDVSASKTSYAMLLAVGLGLEFLDRLSEVHEGGNHVWARSYVGSNLRHIGRGREWTVWDVQSVNVVNDPHPYPLMTSDM